MGLVLIYFIQKINIIKFHRLALVIYFSCFILLLLSIFFSPNPCEVPHRSGIFQFLFNTKPTDIACLSLFILLAKLTEDLPTRPAYNRKRIFKIFSLVFVSFVLVFYINFYSGLLLLCTCLLVICIKGVPIKFLLASATICFMCLFILIMLPNINKSIPTGNWQQTNDSFVTDNIIREKELKMKTEAVLLSGGIFGVVPMNYKKIPFLRQAYRDYTFGILIEKFGVIGGLIIVILYVLFMWNCLLISKKISFTFGSRLVLIFGISIFMQAFVLIITNILCIPFTEIGLPFISLPESSFLTNCLEVGMILSVGRDFETIERKKIKNANNVVDRSI